MAKGVSVKFKSHAETIPQLLEVLKVGNELKKHDKIILKPTLTSSKETSTSPAFIEQVLRYCLHTKNPSTKIIIAEGADGFNTDELFEEYGYRKLSERYDVSLVDLNNAETETITKRNFLKFSEIEYPKILLDGFIISLPVLADNEETKISGSLSTMLGAFPAVHYKGFLTKRKNKIRQWNIENAVYDINQCKTPNFAVMDASSKGVILAGVPLEIDKQSAKLLGKEWKTVPYIRLFEDHPPEPPREPKEKSDKTQQITQ